MVDEQSLRTTRHASTPACLARSSASIWAAPSRAGPTSGSWPNWARSPTTCMSARMRAVKNRMLVVTDDDISGTFAFLRALPDHGNSRDLTPAQIGETWLNYIIDRRTILWWGGMGNSTEHTAYLRLKRRYPGAAQRLLGPQRPGNSRADRRPDLHRRLGHGRARRPGTGRRSGPPRRQRQPRRRRHPRRPGRRRHGGAGLRGAETSTR